MKVNVQDYKKSIYEIGLDKDSEAVIWDFYVTKAICKSASQKRSASDYGLSKLPYEEMLEVAGVAADNAVILLADTMKETLKKLDLETEAGSGKNKHPIEIETEECRFAIITPYRIADDKAPEAKCGKAESLLTHIRNALAHGNTYFFDDGKVMLEDKDSQGKITARIIVKKETLFDWIRLIDFEERYYHIYRR
ncbi:hypothetical protein D1155_07100 [Anaerotruncus sp. 80]|uniref:pEK499-p136 HEPN domain-containing protein n=1 Tax=Anaerotruncus colihominis TaxID=169435 RepID=A0A845QH04_9FIRM|nr:MULTISPECIES: hypothetical protein [Anaerotruncus]NBH61412.1 hypothetical protein [Anaerotruncus colihominis]NCF02067.1 hypothetical protein [Anaerotruncus sp. 80]